MKDIRDKGSHIVNLKKLNIYKVLEPVHLSPTSFKLETHDMSESNQVS